MIKYTSFSTEQEHRCFFVIHEIFDSQKSFFTSNRSIQSLVRVPLMEREKEDMMKNWAKNLYLCILGNPE